MTKNQSPTTDWKVLIGLAIGIVVAAGLVTAAVSYTPVSGDHKLTANSGASIVVTGASEINLSRPWINDTAVRVETASGNLTMVGSGEATATVAASDIEGATTALTAIDASTSSLTINPDDKPAFTVGKNIDTVTVHGGLALDDGSIDLSYSGPDGTDSRLTLRGFSSGKTVGAIDASTGELLDVATVGASGTLTFDALANSAHDVYLQTSDGGASFTNGSPDGTTVYTGDPQLEVDVSDPDFPGDNVTLEWSVDGSVVSTTYATSNGTYSTTVSGLAEGAHDWSVTATDEYGNTETSATYSFTVDHYDPGLSDPQPSGELTERPSELSVNMTDRDFSIDGDTVSLAFSLDGSSIDTVTANSNGTYSVSLPDRGVTGGEHTFTVVATDEYGGTETITGSYTVPANLSVYNESAPTQLIQSSAGLTIRFFGQSSDEVYERTVTDGTVDLTGLPVDERFVVTVSDNNGSYYYRRIVVDSIFKQGEIYLLPTSSTSVDVELTFTDYTGRFPPGDTYLFIEAPIRKDFDGDGSDETRYQTISGDTIGPTGTYPATLAKDERYRLRIRNQPNQRLLGGYTATQAEFEEIAIRGQELEPPEEQSWATKRIVEEVDGQRQLTWKFSDQEMLTTELSLRLTYRANDTVVYEDIITNESGIKNYTVYDIPLSNHTAYRWNWTAVRGGETIGATVPVGRGTAPLTIPLDPAWLGTGAMVAIVFIAALAGARKHTYIAMAVVAMAGVLMYLNAIKISVPMWWLAALIAVGGHLRYRQATPG